MKRHLWICLLLILSVMLTACLKQTATEENMELHVGYTEQPSSKESSLSEESFPKDSQEKTLVLSVNGNDLDVTLEDNETVD